MEYLAKLDWSVEEVVGSTCQKLAMIYFTQQEAEKVAPKPVPAAPAPPPAPTVVADTSSKYAHLGCCGRCWHETTDHIMEIFTLDCLDDDDDLPAVPSSRFATQQMQLERYLAPTSKGGYTLPPSSSTVVQAV